MGVRIAICQPVVPRYRVPVFNLLGAQPGIELTVYGGEQGYLLGYEGGATHFQFVSAPIHAVPLPKLQLRIQPAQRRIIDPGRYDLVILCWDIHFLDLLPAIWKGRRRGVPVALWGHGYSKHESRWRRFLRNWVARSANAVVFYTRSVADHMIAEGGFDADKVFVAQNALDQQPIREAHKKWTADPGTLAAFQRQHGLDPTQTIVFVSRLMPDNGVDLLLHGLARVRRTRPDAKLVILGDGPDRPRLERLCGELRQQEHVHFTGAIYDEQCVAPWMLSATLFCYPRNIGLSLLHAFGYGLPVVTSDDLAGHNPEIEALKPSVNGLLYRDGDLDDIVRQWLDLMNDPTLRQRLSTAASRTVTDRYTLDHMVQGYLHLIGSVDGQMRQVQAVPEAMANDRGL